MKVHGDSYVTGAGSQRLESPTIVQLSAPFRNQGGAYPATMRHEIRRNRIFLIFMAISLIAAATVFNEITVTRYLSDDGILAASTVWTIRAMQVAFAASGIAVLVRRRTLEIRPTQVLLSGVGIAMCVLYVFLTAQDALGSPANNYDMLPYIASAIEYDTADINRIHIETYAAVKQSGVDFTHGPYWEDMAASPEHFHQLLPIYAVKPLYVLLIYALHKVGFAYVRSSVLISVVSMVVAFLVIAVWLRRFITGWWGALAILVANIAALGEAARLSTPDALSCLLTLLSLFLLVEKRRTELAYAILVLSLLARPDNIVLAFAVVGYLHVAGPRFLSTSRLNICLFVVTCGALIVTVQHLTGYYGWWTTFAHTFTGFLKAPAEFNQPFSFSVYVKVLTNALRGDHLQHGMAFLGLFLLLTVTIERPYFRGEQVYSHLSIAMAIALIGRLILFPNWEDRFFVAYYSMSVICFIGALSLRMRRSATLVPHGLGVGCEGLSLNKSV